MVTTVPGGRLPSLLGLRFAAALAVFSFHIYAQNVIAEAGEGAVAQRFAGHAAAWLAFFFILSGFVLTWSAKPGRTARSIWRRRMMRIFPNHVVMWLVVAFGIVLIGQATLSVATFTPGLVLLQAWVPRPDVYFALNTPAWSLSCEVAFYVALPLLLRLVGRIPQGRLGAAAVALVLGTVAVSLLALALPSDVRDWFVWIFPGSRLLEFVLGMVLARIVQAGRGLDIRLGPAAACVVVGFFSFPYVPAPFAFAVCVVVPLALLIVAVARSDLRGTWSPLRSNTMLWLGELAFAFYLVHQIVIRGVHKLLDGPEWSLSSGPAIVLAMLAASLIASWLLNRIVERPMVRGFSVRPPRRAGGEPSPIAADN
jgi:peptidoglycan/LPS O-acetylase OafA/YrhL